MTEPYYLLEYNISLANFDLIVNDVVVHTHTEGGSIHSQYPINHFILSSGNQSFSVVLKPVEGELINPNAEAQIKINVLDSANGNFDNQQTITKLDAPALNEKKLPELKIGGVFKAEVPYQTLGWVASHMIDVKNENSLKLVNDFYRSIYLLFRDKKINELSALLKKRYQETDTSMYLEEDNLSALKNMFAMLAEEDYVLQEFPNQTKLEFYAQNKMLNLKRKNHSPIISYLKKGADEEFGFPFYIHLPKGNNGFEIIR